MRPILAAMFCASVAACGGNETSVGGVSGCTTRAYETIGGPFQLVDNNGLTVTEASYTDKPNLVFFGFTYCTGICQGALRTIDLALDKLPDDVERPRTILISVDPERDTPEALTAFIGSRGFPEDIVALTGPEKDIEDLMTAFGTWVQRVELPDSALGYTYDHGTLVYLMDENWQLKTLFTHEQTPDDIATCLAQVL